MSLSGSDIIIILGVAIVLVAAALYFLNRWSYQKMSQQTEAVERAKMTTSIFVIDKKKDKITNVNLPKVILEQMPKYYKLLKFHFVKAKVGPQIVTLMCEKKVFNAIPLKKNIKVDLAGIYIVEIKGMKTQEAYKKEKKEKKEKEKLDKKKTNK